MTMTRELEAEFYERYEYPVIEPYILGYSGIDPPKKVNMDGEHDHERLSNLLGGNEFGHYHPTGREYYELCRLLEYPPEILSGQVIECVPNDEMDGYEIKGRYVRR